MPPVAEAPVLEEPPGVLAPPLAVPPPNAEELSGLDAPLELLLPPGVVALPVLELPLGLSETMAKSILPRCGSIMTSLMVPNSLPELLVN